MSNQKSITTFIFIAGFLMEVFFLVFICFNGKVGNIPLYMFIYFEAFLIMLITLYLIKKLGNDEQNEEEPTDTKKNNSLLKIFCKNFILQKKRRRQTGNSTIRDLFRTYFQTYSISRLAHYFSRCLQVSLGRENLKSGI